MTLHPTTRRRTGVPRPAGALRRRRPAAALRPGIALAGAGALAVLAAGPAAAATAPDDPGLVRLAHVGTAGSELTVALTPLDATSPVLVEDVGYGEVTGYERLAAGFYTATVRPSGEPDALPLLAASLQVQDEAPATVAVTGVGDDTAATVLRDDLRPAPPGQARVRVLQGAGIAGGVDVTTADGTVVADDLTAGTATGYADVPAETWRLRVAPATGDVEPSVVDVRLEPRSARTLLVLEGPDALTVHEVPDEVPTRGARGATRTASVPVATTPAGDGTAAASSTAAGTARGTALDGTAGETDTATTAAAGTGRSVPPAVPAVLAALAAAGVALLVRRTAARRTTPSPGRR